FLSPRNFIFFPKSWLIRTGLDKKFVEPVSSGRKIGNSKKSGSLLFLGIYLFSEGLAHKN
ncbi:hypothetical protein, partial [Carnobacterium sp.]|uniref:hypothetical protein n=1 Tax=Carnobacterium sp. TaxID=48221 RepID=UPI002FC605FE